MAKSLLDDILESTRTDTIRASTPHDEQLRMLFSCMHVCRYKCLITADDCDMHSAVEDTCTLLSPSDIEEPSNKRMRQDIPSLSPVGQLGYSYQFHPTQQPFYSQSPWGSTSTPGINFSDYGSRVTSRETDDDNSVGSLSRVSSTEIGLMVNNSRLYFNCV